VDRHDALTLGVAREVTAKALDVGELRH
jgi:hypothetical protein